MSVSTALLRILERRNKESQKTLSVARGQLRDAPPGNATLLLYFWCSKTFDGPVISRIERGQRAQCFAAYHLFDFRLWRSNPLEAAVRRFPEIVQLERADPSTDTWLLSFVVGDPNPFLGGDDIGHDAQFDICNLMVQGCGGVFIESTWKAGRDEQRQVGTRIYLECVEAPDK